MEILLSISTVFFVILCVLLVILILLQSDKSAGMGLLGGSSQSAFGSSTADVITKITAVMIAIFMFGSLGLAVIKANSDAGIKNMILKKEKTTTGSIQEGEQKSQEEDKALDINKKETKEQGEESGKNIEKKIELNKSTENNSNPVKNNKK